MRTLVALLYPGREVWRLVISGLVAVLVTGCSTRIHPPGSGGGQVSSHGSSEPDASHIPVLVDGERIATLTRESLNTLKRVDFRDPLSGEVQQGWRVRDILVNSLAAKSLDGECRIVFISTVRHKKASVTLRQIQQSPDKVILLPARRGDHFKICGKLPGFARKKEWVQWVTSVELETGAGKREP